MQLLVRRVESRRQPAEGRVVDITKPLDHLMHLAVEFAEVPGEFLRRGVAADGFLEVDGLGERRIGLPEELRHRSVGVAFLKVFFEVLLDVVELVRERVGPLADQRRPVSGLPVTALVLVLVRVRVGLDRPAVPRPRRTAFLMLVRVETIRLTASLPHRGVLFVLVNRRVGPEPILADRPTAAREADR